MTKFDQYDILSLLLRLNPFYGAVLVDSDPAFFLSNVRRVG